MSETLTSTSNPELLVKEKLAELVEFRKTTDSLQEFWGKQFDLGLAWVQFPEGAGGLGLNPKYQLIITETLRKEGISQQNRVANILGIGMGWWISKCAMLLHSWSQFCDYDHRRLFFRPTVPALIWSLSLAILDMLFNLEFYLRPIGTRNHMHM